MSYAICGYYVVHLADRQVGKISKLMTLDTKSNSLDDAREYIKALAPWIKDVRSNMAQI